MGVFLVFLASSLWALDTLIRYPLLNHLSAFHIVLIEHAILALVFSYYLVKERRFFLNLPFKDILAFLVIGGLGSAWATLCFTKAFMLINPSVVILLQKLQPIVAIVLARIFLGETVRGKFMIWAALALVGAFLISYKDISPLFNNFSALSDASLMGYVFALLAVVSWGAATVFGKRLSSIGAGTFHIMSGRFLVGFLSLLPFAFSDLPTNAMDLEYMGKISLMVFLSGLVGMFFYYKGLKRISARLCTLCEMFFPFAAVILNWIFLDLRLGLMEIAGGILLLIASLVIQLRRY